MLYLVLCSVIFQQNDSCLINCPSRCPDWKSDSFLLNCVSSFSTPSELAPIDSVLRYLSYTPPHSWLTFHLDCWKSVSPVGFSVFQGRVQQECSYLILFHIFSLSTHKVQFLYFCIKGKLQSSYILPVQSHLLSHLIKIKWVKPQRTACQSATTHQSFTFICLVYFACSVKMLSILPSYRYYFT